MNQDPYLSKDLDYLLTSSSFKYRTTAEAITSKAINANQSKINNYLFGNQIGHLEIIISHRQQYELVFQRGKQAQIKSQTPELLSQEPLVCLPVIKLLRGTQHHDCNRKISCIILLFDMLFESRF